MDRGGMEIAMLTGETAGESCFDKSVYGLSVLYGRLVGKG